MKTLSVPREESPGYQGSEPPGERQLDALRRRASLEVPMAEAGQARVIKRYANRKLYDTQDSKYVTLDRIAELVRNGEEVKVLDNKSQKDMTKVTLAQIIYEEQKSGNATAWSVQSLRGFIQQGRQKLVTSLKEGPVGKLVGRAEELGHEVYSAADDRVRGVLETASTHVRQLQNEILRLQARIEELETKLRQGSPKDEPPDTLE
jgi:polyhydroxyalkanoate synthesis repressor PhaR